MGNIYYISQSQGDDRNSGRDPQVPWKSLAPLASIRLGAGDQVLLHGGERWQGMFRLDVSGGTADNPIRLSSYGEGDKPELCCCEGKPAARGTGICLSLENANGLVLEGLSIGCANLGIRLTYDKAHFGSESVRLIDCHFHDIYGVTQLDGLSEIYVSAGLDIELTGTTAEEREHLEDNWPLTGLYLERCTAFDAGSLVCGPVGVHGFYMTDCVARANGYYGTTVFGCRGGAIERCVFDGNGTRPMPAGSCGIMISAEDFLIKDTVVANQQRQGDDPDGCGIDFEWQCRDISVENCLLSGNAGVGVMFFTSGQGERGANYRCRIDRCLFLDNHTNPGNIFGGEIFLVAHGLKEGRLSDNRFRRMDGVEFAAVIDGLDAAEAGCNFIQENNTAF